MKIPTFKNKLQFEEDYADQIKNATTDDAEEALMELCEYIEPWEDGDHWLEVIGERTVSGQPVFFWFTADLSDDDMVFTYREWAHHY